MTVQGNSSRTGKAGNPESEQHTSAQKENTFIAKAAVYVLHIN